MDFRRAKTLEKYKDEGLKIELEKKQLLELGNGYELDLEQLDIHEAAVEAMNLPDNVKQKAILKIQRAKLELQKAYTEKVEKPIGEKEKELYNIQKEMEDVIKEIQDAVKDLESIDIGTGGEDITGDMGITEMKDAKSNFEKEKEIIKAKQLTIRELLQKQKVDILRHNIGNGN